jgi:hypothetical protein
MKIFKAWGSIVRCWEEWKGDVGKPDPPFHRYDEPTRLFLGTVASQQSRLPLHPAGRV